ncbi:Protein ANTI-SILENCING 1 [Hirschfeldia incana]|nr:Protein ANTI-SILENCING 1 [Hirschfeldia incana]
MEEAPRDAGLEFKWGKKRGVGGKNKDVQFYESFTFDGDEYSLYDSVLVGDPNEPGGSHELFVAKIIKIWEHTNKRAKTPRQVKLLWFFRPSEISPNLLEGVPDVLAKELFLASGEGPGLANVNPLEAICGKCSVVCISKDKRNPQPTDEDVKSADFVFRRAFDVGSCKVLDTIDDKIAGVNVAFLFNGAGSKKEATAVQKVQEDMNGNLDSLKPNGLPACGSVRETEDNSVESSDRRESSYGREEGKERSKKDSSVQKSTAHLKEHEDCEASGSGEDHCDGNKAQESEVKKQFTKQKSLPAEARYSNTCEASGSRVNHSDPEKPQENDVGKSLTKQKSIPRGERYSQESNGLDDRPQKKQKLDGSATVLNGDISSDGKRDTEASKRPRDISSDNKRDTEAFKRPRDKETGDEVPPEKLSLVKEQRDLGASVSEGKDVKTATEKGLAKKPSFDGKLLKRADDETLADDYERGYQVIEVKQKPDAVNSKWFRPLPWEESMREAEKEERLVLLQNLDPTYTSDEVQDIVYSALNEQSTARMIERTSVTISHTGEALVIFNSRQAAERAIRRLDKGCLLLSSGRTLVAGFAKINPPGKPSSFCGHIKLQKTQMRREMRDSVSTSHGSQPNTLEYEMAMAWCLHQARSDHAFQTVIKFQNHLVFFLYRNMYLSLKRRRGSHLSLVERSSTLVLFSGKLIFSPDVSLNLVLFTSIVDEVKTILSPYNHSFFPSFILVWRLFS